MAHRYPAGYKAPRSFKTPTEDPLLPWPPHPSAAPERSNGSLTLSLKLVLTTLAPVRLFVMRAELSLQLLEKAFSSRFVERLEPGNAFWNHAEIVILHVNPRAVRIECLDPLCGQYVSLRLIHAPAQEL